MLDPQTHGLSQRRQKCQLLSHGRSSVQEPAPITEAMDWLWFPLPGARACVSQLLVTPAANSCSSDMKMKSNDKLRGQHRGEVSMYSGLFVSVLLFLASNCLSAASREPFAGVLQTTFTNPAPADSDAFGAAFAFVRNDRVIIG